MAESLEDLFKQAVAAVRAGRKAEAKQMLIQVLKANPRSETAWIWMSAAVETDNERIHCLKQVISINPQNEMALKGLRAMGALSEPEPPPPAPEPEPEYYDDTPSFYSQIGSEDQYQYEEIVEDEPPPAEQTIFPEEAASEPALPESPFMSRDEMYSDDFTAPEPHSPPEPEPTQEPSSPFISRDELFSDDFALPEPYSPSEPEPTQEPPSRFISRDELFSDDFTVSEPYSPPESEPLEDTGGAPDPFDWDAAIPPTAPLPPHEPEQIQQQFIPQEPPVPTRQLGASAEPATAPVPAVDLPPAPDGVPFVAQEAIIQATREVTDVLAAIETERNMQSMLGIQWAPYETLREKTRGRVDLRPTPMMMIVGGAVALVVVVVVIVSQIMATVRERQFLASITPSPTPTITLTPAPTVTPMPTRTPSPAGSTGVLEPQIPVEDAPRGDLAFGITPTAPYVVTPHRANPRMEDTLIAFHEGRYNDALELLAIAREREPDAIDGYFVEALSLFRLGQYDEANTALESGLALNDGFAPLHFVQGEIYMHEGKFEQARTSYQQAKTIDENYIDAYVGLSKAYTALGRYSDALAEVETARVKRKYHVGSLIAASRAYLAQGDAENATAFANLAFYIDPTSEDVVVALAKGRLALNLNEKAAIGLEDFLFTINPSSAQAWGLLGFAYGRLERNEDAEVAFARTFQLSGNIAEALIGRGLFYYDHGQYNLAYDDLTEGLKSVPATPDILFALADSAFTIGKFDEAADLLDEIRDLNPDMPAARVEVLYARALSETGEHTRALAAATEANNNLNLALTDAQRAYLFEVRGKAFLAQEDYPNAEFEFDQALGLVESGTGHYLKALALQAQGSIQKAVNELEWVLFWDSVFDYPFADDAAVRLDTLKGVLESGS